MNINFKYYKPRNTTVVIDVEETEEITSKQTVYTEQNRKKAKRNVPIMAKVYPETFIKLAQKESELRMPGLFKVAFYLVAKLDKVNELEISVKAKEIQQDLILSDRTVTKALDFLESEGLIEVLGRGKYRVSPKLGFYGYPVEWGIALENDLVDVEETYNKIKLFNSQTREINKKHLDNRLGEQQ